MFQRTDITDERRRAEFLRRRERSALLIENAAEESFD